MQVHLETKMKWLDFEVKRSEFKVTMRPYVPQTHFYSGGIPADGWPSKTIWLYCCMCFLLFVISVVSAGVINCLQRLVDTKWTVVSGRSCKTTHWLIRLWQTSPGVTVAESYSCFGCVYLCSFCDLALSFFCPCRSWCFFMEWHQFPSTANQ